MGNGERDNAAASWIRENVFQVDPEGNPEQVMGPGDDVPRPATSLERFVLGIPRPLDSLLEQDAALASGSVVDEALHSVRVGTKPTNPKDAVGSDKLPLHLWPETATAFGCLGMLDGALKYGRNNFRETGVRLSIYVDAARRHLNALFEGEWFDPDSGVPHLSHALACLAIIADAHAAGKLNNDAQYPGGYRELVTELTPHVARLKGKHADKSPHHFTIADGPTEPKELR